MTKMTLETPFSSGKLGSFFGGKVTHTGYNRHCRLPTPLQVGLAKCFASCLLPPSLRRQQPLPTVDIHTLPHRFQRGDFSAFPSSRNCAKGRKEEGSVRKVFYQGRFKQGVRQVHTRSERKKFIRKREANVH